jgi:quercetin dioxygenase-like cupin family protein
MNAPQLVRLAPNQIISNDATGKTLTMLVSEEENSGACQLYEVGQPPRPSPPLHYHVDFVETFIVKQGQLDIYVDRDRKHLLLLPADSATAHIRQPHRTGSPTTAAQPKTDGP